MSKGNMLLGQARGKVGDVVFSRAYGQQITRSKATSVANPKTYGQNVQRAILATIAKAAAALTPIVDHSFANIKYGGESVRHFRKINMGELRALYLAEGGTNFNLTAKGGSFVPNYLKISEGNLPQFAFDSNAGENPAFPMSNVQLNAVETATSVEDFKKSYPYIQGGDQLTLVKVRLTSGSLTDGDAIFAVSYDRMVFAPNAFDDNDAEIIGSDDFINPDLLDLAKTTDVQMLCKVTSGAGRWLGIARDSDTNADIYAVALILSRKVNNQWQRSTQYLQLCEFTDSADNSAAVDSYGASESIQQATEYLNQATEGSKSAGISGAYMQLTAIGENAPSAQAIEVGETAALGDIEIETGKDLSLAFAAYGTEDNPLIALDLTGTSIDGPVSIKAKVKNNAASLNFNVGEDGNLAGTYSVTAVYRSGRAVANFTLSTGA